MIISNLKDQLAQKYLTMDQVNILMVGDKAQIKPGLERLGYDIIELEG